MKPRKDPIAWRDVHGIVLLDKPTGLSSNQALQTVRRIFAAAKGGHTGSLDPLATGLLPICLGEATKIAGLLLGASKAYLADVCLGVTTTTADADGQALLTRPVPQLDALAIDAALLPLRGRIKQVPPVYSAIKQGGVPLYKRARQGEEVSAPVREVQVDRLELVEHHGNHLRLLVECGSGTYVRSLATDLGEALGCGAHLAALRRTWVEPFRTPRMVDLATLSELSRNGDLAALDALLLDVDSGLIDYPLVEVDQQQAMRLRQGQPVQSAARAADLCRVHCEGQLIALGKIDADAVLRVVRGLNLVP